MMKNTNNYNILWGGVLATISITACQSDAHLHNSYQIGDKHCFLLHTKDMNEWIEIEFDAQGFAGQGQGYLPVADKNYKILLKGDCDGLNCKINRQITYLENKSQPFSQEEEWLFGDKTQFVVAKREIATVQSEQAFIYRLFNCPQAAKKDSSLYDFISHFNDGHAVVSQNGRFGIVDSNMKLTVNCIYPNIGDINEGTAVFAGENYAYVGILDIKGQIIAPAQYEQASNFSNNRAAVIPKGDTKWGFINRKNELVIPAQYNQIFLYEGLPEVRPFLENLAPVTIDDLWGFIDTNGKTVIPFQYEHAKGFKEGKAHVFFQEKWQYIDKNGKISD